MKAFRFLWICSSVFIFGCVGLQTKTYRAFSQNDFMADYCQGGKQKKLLQTTVIYFTPNIEKSLGLGKANYKIKILSEQKDECLKSLFYFLGDSSMQDSVGNHGDEPSWYLLTSPEEKDVLAEAKSDNSTTKHKLFTFIIKISSQNKFIIYQSNFDSRRLKYEKGYSTDLHNLMWEYTILTPKEIIEEITGSEFDKRYLHRTILLDEDGQIDISKALTSKNELWHAYIKKYTRIKEVSDDNSNQSTIELSLDLNVFCKYGRKISDLQSQ